MNAYQKVLLTSSTMAGWGNYLFYLERKAVQDTEYTKPTPQTDQTQADYVHNASSEKCWRC